MEFPRWVFFGSRGEKKLLVRSYSEYCEAVSGGWRYSVLPEIQPEAQPEAQVEAQVEAQEPNHPPLFSENPRRGPGRPKKQR